METALYHTLGRLPEPNESTHRFSADEALNANIAGKKSLKGCGTSRRSGAGTASAGKDKGIAAEANRLRKEELARLTKLRTHKLDFLTQSHKTGRI